MKLTRLEANPILGAGESGLLDIVKGRGSLESDDR